MCGRDKVKRKRVIRIPCCYGIRCIEVDDE